MQVGTDTIASNKDQIGVQPKPAAKVEATAEEEAELAQMLAL